MVPEIFDRDTHPLDATWLLTASFYETRNHPSDHETNADSPAQAGSNQIHSPQLEA